MTAARIWTALLFLPPLLLAAALFGPVLLAPQGYAPATCDDDFYMYYLPMADVAFGMWREGTLPLWNPYLYAGMPLLASIEVGVLYPPNWLHLVVSTERAFCLLYVFHAALAAGGTWWFARQRGLRHEAALFAVVSFTFASPTILHHDKGMTSIVYSAAWFPAILAMINRVLARRTFRSACGLAGLLACQFLAGFPLFTLALAWMIAGSLLTFSVNWKQPWGSSNRVSLLLMLTAAGLALGLVAPQLLSTLDYLAQSRRSDLSYAQSTHACLPVLNLLTMIIPGAFGNDRGCPYWGEALLADSIIFSGVTTLLLATLSLGHARRREVVFWGLLTVLVIGVALGDGSFLYDLCYLYIPGVSRFRGVSRLSIFALFGVSMLAAYGLEVLLTTPPRRARSLIYGSLGGLAALIGLWTLLPLTSASTPTAWTSFFEWVRAPGTELMSQFPEAALPGLQQQSFAWFLRSLGIAAATVAAGCLLIVVGTRRPQWRTAVCPLLLTLTCWELFSFDREFLVLMDAAPWKVIARQAREALPVEDEPYRIAAFSVNPPLPPNRFLYERLYSTGGHENFVLERYSQFLEFWLGIPPEWQTYMMVPNAKGIYNTLNVRYFFSPTDQPKLQSTDTLIQANVFTFRDRDFSLYRNETALPRALLVHRAQPVSDGEAGLLALPSLYSGSVRNNSFYEGALQLPGFPAKDADPSRDVALVREHRPGRVVIDVQTTAPALLVYLGNYDPGWTATVDGRPVPVLPTNVWMRGIPVPAGAQRVEMVYDPAAFRWGCRIALVTGLLMLAGGVFSIVRRRLATASSNSANATGAATTRRVPR